MENSAEVAADLWRITTPLNGRPRSVHAYFARLEAGWMLVDGGADTDAAWEVLDTAVRRIAGAWREVRLLAATHMHLDHLGLTHRAQDASTAPIAMGQLDAERTAGAAADPDGELAYRASVLREAGAPERLWAWARPTPGAGGGSSPAGADHLLCGEGGLLPGAPGWRWVWTPGHTAGHVSLLRMGDGALIGGDAVLASITPTLGVNRQREDPVGDYLDGLDRLLTLDLRVAFGGHGGTMDRPAERIAELRDATRAETVAVHALLNDNGRTGWEVAADRYAGRELPRAAELQALRETLAHLHHLERRGMVVRTAESPARFAR